MTLGRSTHVTILVRDEQMAEVRHIMAAEPGVLTVLPTDHLEPLRTALAFYAEPANWIEGVGTGPNRPAPCVADGGARAREALGQHEGSAAANELSR